MLHTSSTARSISDGSRTCSSSSQPSRLKNATCSGVNRRGAIDLAALDNGAGAAGCEFGQLSPENRVVLLAQPLR